MQQRLLLRSSEVRLELNFQFYIIHPDRYNNFPVSTEKLQVDETEAGEYFDSRRQYTESSRRAVGSI